MEAIFSATREVLDLISESLQTRFSNRMTTYTALHNAGPDANRCIHAGTKFMRHGIASTNARSVSKATRPVTCRQQNIVCEPGAHTAAAEKRGDDRADIVGSRVGHARKRWRI
jgi:hypothetical protein